MNVITLAGHLETDPVHRETTAGIVCEFRVAADTRPPLTIVVQTRERLAARCAPLRNGQFVAVSGQLICEPHVTRSGETATRWFVLATSVSFLEAGADHA